MIDRKAGYGIDMSLYAGRRTTLKLGLAIAGLIACGTPRPDQCVEEKTEMAGIESGGMAVYPCGKEHPETAGIAFRINSGVLNTPEGFLQYSKPDNKFAFQSQLTFQKERGAYYFAGFLAQMPGMIAKDRMAMLISGELFEPGKDTYVYFSWDKWQMRNPIINMYPLKAGKLEAGNTVMRLAVPKDRFAFVPSTIPKEFYLNK